MVVENTTRHNDENLMQCRLVGTDLVSSFYVSPERMKNLKKFDSRFEHFSREVLLLHRQYLQMTRYQQGKKKVMNINRKKNIANNNLIVHARHSCL